MYKFRVSINGYKPRIVFSNTEKVNPKEVLFLLMLGILTALASILWGDKL